MPQLDFATFPSQLLWLAIIFALQYIIISKIIVPGFKVIYAARQSYINVKVKYAEAAAVEAEELKKSYEERLEQTRLSNIKRMNEVTDEVQKLIEQRMHELEVDLAKDFKSYEKSIQELRASMENELDKTAMAEAANIIYKITNKTVNQKNFSKYIN